MYLVIWDERPQELRGFETSDSDWLDYNGIYLNQAYEPFSREEAKAEHLGDEVYDAVGNWIGPRLLPMAGYRPKGNITDIVVCGILP